MRHLSPILLLIAAASAVAQEPPAPEPAPVPAGEPAGTEPASPTTATPAAPAAGATANARLAPGGVLESGSSFPLGIQANLSNSVGNGFLAPGFQAQPQFSTSLSLTPSAKLPKLEGLPAMRLSGGISFSVANWISTYSNSGVFDRQVRVSDASVGLVLPGLFTEEFTGIGASLSFGATLPLSITSRQSNVVTAVSVGLPLAWSSPETGFGTFYVQYSPRVRATLFSQVGTTMPCGLQQEYGTPRRLGDPVNGFDDLPTFIAIGGDPVFTDNGECLLPGRQRLAAISNAINTGWSTTDGAHSVSLGLGMTHSFLRGLPNKPELNSPNSSGQNFTESASGSVGYTYTVPVDFPLQLSVSAGSEGSVFTNDNKSVRFPIWDFLYPANNASGVSFDVTVGI
ncbi:MAG: hypothetical protein Q8O67_13740 [Deltaproteobacteria bacterium]|nr:hypothetical protein [Deltaproteobacteria bacterium]